MQDRYTIDTLDGFDYGQLATVGVGYVTTQPVEYGDIDIGPGDLVYWEDPDVGLHTGECPALSDRDYVAPVDKVYLVDYDWVDGYAVEVGVKAPLGRLGIEDAVFAQQDHPDHIGLKFEQFQESDYSKYMKWEGHFDLRDVPEQYAEGHENARPSCWYDGEGYGHHVDGE